MATLNEQVLGGVDAGRELRRPPMVGMDFLHQRPMRTGDLLKARPRLQAKELIRFLLGHYARPEWRPSLTEPKVRVRLAVRTPSGRAAVTISFSEP